MWDKQTEIGCVWKSFLNFVSPKSVIGNWHHKVYKSQNTFKKALDEKQCILGNSLGRGNQIFLFNKNWIRIYIYQPEKQCFDFTSTWIKNTFEVSKVLWSHQLHHFQLRCYNVTSIVTFVTFFHVLGSVNGPSLVSAAGCVHWTFIYLSVTDLPNIPVKNRELPFNVKKTVSVN